jgi:hypothetical protein
MRNKNPHYWGFFETSRPVLMVVGYSPAFFFLHAKQSAHLPQVHFFVSPTPLIVCISISGQPQVCDEISGSVGVATRAPLARALVMEMVLWT